MAPAWRSSIFFIVIITLLVVLLLLRGDSRRLTFTTPDHQIAVNDASADPVADLSFQHNSSNKRMVGGHYAATNVTVASDHNLTSHGDSSVDKLGKSIGSSPTDELQKNSSFEPAAEFRNPCYAGNLRSWRPSGCADDNAWLVPWMTKRPKTKWTLIDVGANKGYVIAGWLETLLGRERTPFTPHNLGVSIYENNHFTSNILAMCGGCQECADPPADVSPDHRASSVKVFAFEPSIANFRWLSFFFNNTPELNLTNAAVSDTPGTAYFPNDVLGKETGKVVTAPQEGYVPVKIVSLDAYLGQELPFVDVLSTDAEGFDQDVAKGARGFIAAGRVGVYQFEMYRQEDYKTIFEQLFEWGYVCYYFTEMRGTTAGKSVPWLIRISKCWHDEYQRYIGWVNGLCYNTKVPHLKAIFEGLELKRHRNTGPSLSKSRARVMSFIRQFVNKSKEKE